LTDNTNSSYLIHFHKIHTSQLFKSPDYKAFPRSFFKSPDYKAFWGDWLLTGPERERELKLELCTLGPHFMFKFKSKFKFTFPKRCYNQKLCLCDWRNHNPYAVYSRFCMNSLKYHNSLFFRFKQVIRKIHVTLLKSLQS